RTPAHSGDSARPKHSCSFTRTTGRPVEYSIRGCEPEGTDNRAGASSSRELASGQGIRRCRAWCISTFLGEAPCAKALSSGPSQYSGSADSTLGHGSPSCACKKFKRSRKDCALSEK